MVQEAYARGREQLKHLRVFMNDETAYFGEFRGFDTKSHSAQSTLHAFQGVWQDLALRWRRWLGRGLGPGSLGMPLPALGDSFEYECHASLAKQHHELL